MSDVENTLKRDPEITENALLVEMEHENARHPFYLRKNSSDIHTYRQIFNDNEYEFTALKAPEVILDAGANIGLASIYFASKYPGARIIAIEPKTSNFQLLHKNTALYANITPIHAALWNTNSKINLVDPGRGYWGFVTDDSKKVSKDTGSMRHEITSITIDKIIADYELDKIDVLKVDIEGAEKEVFSDASSWINRVDSIIIELHERIKPGCKRSVYNSTDCFEHIWQKGENIYISRGNYLKKQWMSDS